MRHGRHWRWTASLLVVGAMVLAGCRGDGEGDDAADTESGMEAEEPSEAESSEDASSEDSGGESDTEAAAGDITIGRGITEEACPEGVNPDNGCIYLGTLSDLTEGPFAALGVSITDAQEAFWARVNEDGGVGGFDVNVTEFVRDNKYNPETHAQLYAEIKGEILGIAQTLGSPTTAAIAGDLDADNMLAAPASWTSAWEFQDVVVESGNNYCVEMANGLDYFARDNEAATVMAVAFPGDYGGDGAAGAQKWAEATGAEFIYVEQVPISTGGTTDGTISQIISQSPDVVALTVAPGETAEIVGGAVAQGFEGRFIGNSPTWTPSLIDSPAAEALIASYWQAGPWAPFDTDTPGHQAMRDALGDVTGNGGYVSGWAWSYPLLAALEAAAESGDMTPEGVRAALTSLETVDYEGMVPAEAGNFAGEAAEQSANQTIIAEPSTETPDGVVLLEDFFAGDTAAEFTFESPCFDELSAG